MCCASHPPVFASFHCVYPRRDGKSEPKLPDRNTGQLNKTSIIDHDNNDDDDDDTNHRSY